MGNFLWKEVSEEEKKEIKKNAKQIMDNFIKKLSKIKLKGEESQVKRDRFEREEGNKKGDDFSKEIMFKNAPQKNEKFIKAESKKWEN